MRILLVIAPGIEEYFDDTAISMNAPGITLDIEEDDLAVMLKISRENKQEIMIKYYE